MNLSGMSKFSSSLIRSFDLISRNLVALLRHSTLRKFYNLCLNYFQRWTRKTVLTAFPFEVIIDPINICNLHCPLCPTGQGKNTRPLGRMNFEQFRHIIDQLFYYLYKIRLYNWGEPFLHKDIYKMIEYTAKKNISVEISTNLNAFKPEDADRLVQSGLELLVVSLDGADQETYSHYRIGGNFERVIENISAIVEAKKKAGSRFPVVEVQFLIMKHNENKIDAIKDLTERLGVDRLRLGPVTINWRNREDHSWLPSNDQMSRYDFLRSYDKIYARRKLCEWLWRSAVINWDGSILPCCVFEGPKAEFGSLSENTFAEIWNNSCYQRARAVFTANRNITGKMNICQRCKKIPWADDEKQSGLY